jgi:hypothetical protein
VAQAQPDLTIGFEQPTDFESNDEGEEAGEPVMDVPVVRMVEEERLFSNGDRLDSDAVIAREEAVATTSDVDEPTIEAVAELRRMPDRTDPIAKGSVVSADNDQMGRSVVNNAQLRHPVSPDYRYTTPVEDALNTIQTKAEKSGPELFIGRPKRNRKKIGAVTVSTIGFVGVLIGLGLYAGGGDLLTKLFPNQERESLTAQPKPVVGGTTSAIVGTAPTSPTAIVPREPDLGTAVEDSPSVAPTVSAAEPVVQSSPAGVEGGEPTGATHQEAVSTGTPVKTEEKPNAVDASSAHFYIVQVRATTDQSEAKRIVRRLKSTGLTDVSVEKTEKTGLHRIRFEYSGTKSEAIAAAEKAGYEDVWIVGRK